LVKVFKNQPKAGTGSRVPGGMGFEKIHRIGYFGVALNVSIPIGMIIWAAQKKRRDHQFGLIASVINFI